MITTKVKWKAIFVSLFFLCLYLFLLYIVIFIAVYITYTYTPDEDDANSQKELAEKGYTLPEYAFVVECGGATSGESGVLEVRGGLRVLVKTSKTGAVLRNTRISLIKNDTVYKTVCTDSNGYFELLDIPIGIFEIKQETP